LLPIFGWFALGGYGVRITKEWTQGKFKELPKLVFVEDMKLGAVMFVKALPFVISYFVVAGILGLIPFLGFAFQIVAELLIVPILSINFIIKQTVESFFEFEILKGVFDNIGEYVVAFLKSFALTLVFTAMMLILVGIPASMFTGSIFLADFYRRLIK